MGTKGRIRPLTLPRAGSCQRARSSLTHHRLGQPGKTSAHCLRDSGKGTDPHNPTAASCI